MTEVTFCVPCQYGQHDEHQDVPNPGSPGLIGGRHECPCRGECRDRAPGPVGRSALRLESWRITPECRQRGLDVAWEDAVGRLRQVYEVQVERFGQDVTLTLSIEREAVSPEVALPHLAQPEGK